MRKVFIDTAAWIALISRADALHEQTKQIMAQLSAQNVGLVTTEFVFLELADGLSAPQRRGLIVSLLENLYQMPGLTILPINRDQYLRGLDLYRHCPDKEWGLTDCISMTVMEAEGISIAFTSDQHFRQAGFQTLLTL